MESYVTSFILEMQNLENEIIVLMDASLPDGFNGVSYCSILEGHYASIKVRLNEISDLLNCIVREADKEEIAIGDNSVTREDLVVALISTSFLKLLTNISLRGGSNDPITNKILVDKLISNTENESSVNSLYSVLIDKARSFDK